MKVVFSRLWPTGIRCIDLDLPYPHHQANASLYGVETKPLKETVRRNIARFPEDFLFILSTAEWNALRTQFSSLKMARGKHPKLPPMAFTAQGIAMLSGILNCQRAIETNTPVAGGELSPFKIHYIYNMNLMTLIRENYTEFVSLCRSHKVDKFYAFGSSITDSFDPKSSDIDVVVKIDIDDPADRGDALLSLWDKLEALFQKKVDLLTEDSIRNPYLRSNINRTKKLIYDGEGEKVFV